MSEIQVKNKKDGTGSGTTLIWDTLTKETERLRAEWVLCNV